MNEILKQLPANFFKKIGVNLRTRYRDRENYESTNDKYDALINRSR
jgi:hypothetical protein